MRSIAHWPLSTLNLSAATSTDEMLQKLINRFNHEEKNLQIRLL